jgi:hypothetical protein
MPGPLPVVARFENDNGGPRLSFACQCGEAVSAYALIEGASAEVRCPKCGVYVQLRASRSYEAEGGKPGSARGKF